MGVGGDSAVQALFEGVVLPGGRSRNCLQVRMRVWGLGVMCGCGVGGDFAVQSHSMGGVRGRAEGHAQEHPHTGTYTRMLHLPFSDLPFKKVPARGRGRVWPRENGTICPSGVFPPV